MCYRNYQVNLESEKVGRLTVFVQAGSYSDSYRRGLKKVVDNAEHARYAPWMIIDSKVC